MQLAKGRRWLQYHTRLQKYEHKNCQKKRIQDYYDITWISERLPIIDDYITVKAY